MSKIRYFLAVNIIIAETDAQTIINMEYEKEGGITSMEDITAIENIIEADQHRRDNKCCARIINWRRFEEPQ